MTAVLQIILKNRIRILSWEYEILTIFKNAPNFSTIYIFMGMYTIKYRKGGYYFVVRHHWSALSALYWGQISDYRNVHWDNDMTSRGIVSGSRSKGYVTLYFYNRPSSESPPKMACTHSRNIHRVIRPAMFERTEKEMLEHGPLVVKYRK